MNPEARSQNSGAGIRKPDARNAPARSFEHLIVWQKAHQFVLGVYLLTEDFPREEIYGLGSQLRRAAISIPANIAEGFKKRGRARQGPLLKHFSRLVGGVPLLRDSHGGSEGRGHPLVSAQLVEVSKMLELYAAKILASDS